MTDSKNAATREYKRPINAVLRPDAFAPYIEELADLLGACKAGKVGEKHAELAAALDGQPGRELRRLYTSDSLRNTGTYFTGSNLANRLVSSRLKIIPRGCRIVDPACGAGDLLVACARHLPVKPELMGTLVEWGKVLVGFDINPAFVEATRYRLALLAIQRISSSANRLPLSLRLAELFPHIQPRSGMEEWQLSKPPTLIVVNPPFSYGVTPNGCVWASGRVSKAALFMDACLNNGSEGARVLAILPDVLRTGTRYRRWRQMVAQNATVTSVEIAGQFDAQTDISVFLLELEISRAGSKQKVDWACPLQTGERTLKDVFEIRVGPVVPFRLDGTGPWSPFAQLEHLPPWGTVECLRRHIRFPGTTYNPPFVAIRRTSKANYQFRCIGTVVAGKKPTAVENHLLVALPRDKKVSTCKKLLALLKTDAATNWMNERIRCRHLTVGSVGDLPWRDTE
jgi:hypothetical protein